MVTSLLCNPVHMPTTYLDAKGTRRKACRRETIHK